MADLKETPDTLPFAVREASGNPQHNGGSAQGSEKEDTRSAVMEINGMRIHEAVEHRVILYSDDLIDMETYLEFSYADRDATWNCFNGVMMEQGSGARARRSYTPLNSATKTSNWRTSRRDAWERDFEGKSEAHGGATGHMRNYLPGC